MKRKKKLIVTLAIGERHQHMFDRFCRSGWRAYADRYDYDLAVITENIDTSSRALRRSPAWQKLLACACPEFEKYDQLVWIDSDILINSSAPDIGALLPPEKISAVNAWAIPSAELYESSLKRQYADWRKRGITFLENLTPGEYYTKRGLAAGGRLNSVVQTGVMVCTPKQHSDLMRYVYYSYEDYGSAAGNYEMPALSYEIITNGLENWLDCRFNFNVTDIISTYYGFLFHERHISEKHLSFFNPNKLAQFVMTSRLLNKNQLLALYRIYQMGHFIHFAGVAQYMGPVSDWLRKSRA